MPRSRLKIALIFLLAFLLAACSATGEKFSRLKIPNSSVGALYVYRLPNFAGGGNAPLLFIDGNDQGSLKNAGYIRKELAVGRHVIELRNGSILSNMKPLTFDLTVEGGTTYFLRYTIEHRGSQHIFGSTAFIHDFYRSFELIERDAALVELKDTNEIK
ncbi:MULTISPECIES: DUF2846 domain-containing protein [unclassified Variovorax]|jgi:hypothetical protein|uniref:DUF2846 domain-containing protein n=1 Tax=unclassified Variovorax TaxID=663243 RepID=UPI0008C84358|nr:MULTISPECIES: DUF2846 domain-containing protein [unclassified Variovorax]SEK14973.1 Protein of unknown function [Variovorax sp. OK202]SFE07102.1 Protein of unknown function [Variovorax sp. OK212]